MQLEIAQLGESEKLMPKLLSIISFTSHIEIMNRCRSDEERIFYMLYAFFHIHPVVNTLLQLRLHGALFVEGDIELNVLIGIFEVHKGVAVPSHFPVGGVFNREIIVLKIKLLLFFTNVSFFSDNILHSLPFIIWAKP